MEDKNRFGKRLRELRKRAGLSLRELGNKVSVDFSYLSKIENGTLPPPSERVIRELAETLNTEYDELLTLAGIIPSDIAEILEDRDTREKLRSKHIKSKTGPSKPKEPASARDPISFKGLYKFALPVFLVIAIAASLWFATPTKAVDITFPSLPSTGTLGSTYTFTVKVNIEDQDLLPIQDIDMYIFQNGDYTRTTSPRKATLADLPLTSTSRSYTNAQTSGGAASVTASASSGWTSGYTYGTGYAAWNGDGYSFGQTYGYGYGSGASYITYTVVWTSPSSWPAANYKVELALTATGPDLNKTFIETSSAFALSAASSGVIGGGGGGGSSEEEETIEEVEEMTTEEAVSAISEMTAEEAAELLEELSTSQAADVIEQIDAETAADIIESLNADIAADILGEVDIKKVIEIFDRLTAIKLGQIIPDMREASLTDILPEISIDKLYSIQPSVLFKSLPGVPVEQLIPEVQPQPATGLDDPIEIFSTATGAKYLATRTLAGEWVKVVGTPAPLEQLLILTNKALTDVGTTLEISEKQPPAALVMLPEEQVVNAYFTIDFENATSDDIDLGHLTFMVEKEWLEQNSLHKWSIMLHRYDPESSSWIAIPTKRIKEDDTYIYYTTVITHFSTFAISGSQELPQLNFEVANIDITPSEAETDEVVTITADITNTSDSSATYVATLWIDRTISAGKDVKVEAGKTETVSFTTSKSEEGNYEIRIDRLLDSLTVGQPVSPVTSPEPEPTPQPVPVPSPAPVPTPTSPPVPTPEPGTNWWLIAGIIVAAIIVATGAWFIIQRRRI